MKNYLNRLKKQFNYNNMFYYAGGVIVGYYIGKYLNEKGTIETIVEVIDEVKS